MHEHELRGASAHPILDTIAAALKPNGSGGFGFTPRAIAEIDVALDAIRERRELARAVLSIAMFAAYLQRDCASPEAAERLCAIALARRATIEELADAFIRLDAGARARQRKVLGS